MKYCLKWKKNSLAVYDWTTDPGLKHLKYSRLQDYRLKIRGFFLHVKIKAKKRILLVKHYRRAIVRYSCITVPI